MTNFLELASTRRSIRKFADHPIPDEDIEYVVRAAVSAPSGCNSQCWKFVAVKDRGLIAGMERAVADEMGRLLQDEDLSEEFISGKKKMAAFFAKAPVVIAVFMTGVDYYDEDFVEILKRKGYTDADFMKLLGHYDLLSIGAAVQNLLLAAHEKGYGACWMNEPAIAAEEIRRILGVSSGLRLISLIPMGHPSYTPREKPMKPWNEVFVLR